MYDINILDGVEDLVDEIEVDIKMNKDEPMIVVGRKYDERNPKNKIVNLLSLYSKYDYVDNNLMFLYFEEDTMIRIVDLITLDEVEVIGVNVIYSITDFINHVAVWINDRRNEIN